MGPVYAVQREAGESCRTALGAEEEKEQYITAKNRSIQALQELGERCRNQGDGEAADILEAQSLMLEGDDFDEMVLEKLSDGLNAEQALYQTGEELYALFSEMEDPYYQARAADGRAIVRQVIQELTGRKGIVLDKPCILLADDLAPAETLHLEKSMILGFLTQEGSVSGHTAILARSMGVPMICGLGKNAAGWKTGTLVCMDGCTGCAIEDPDEETQRRFRLQICEENDRRNRLAALVDEPDITADGRTLRLYCNVASETDVDAVLGSGARGIGLFRTEFLYLQSKDYPTEEEQFRAYRAVAEAMAPRPVIIRTLDIGADKSADYFNLKREENPALGMRAIRICLTRPELFKTQLRALYRASAYGSISIMFPMIASCWELDESLRLCDEVMQELEQEGKQFSRDVQRGIMVETPAAVLMAEELAEKADFFSIGTNDLTQYTLACDRQSNELGRFADPHHPAVLRAIRHTVQAAHHHGKWAGICGELGADVSMLETFVNLGVDELSVSPAAVLSVRERLRQLGTVKKS